MLQADHTCYRTQIRIILPLSALAFSSPAPEWDGQGIGLCLQLGG